MTAALEELRNLSRESVLNGCGFAKSMEVTRYYENKVRKLSTKHADCCVLI